MSFLLEAKGISVSYGSIRALRDVTMSVEAGEIACLIGANGAGKSTLLKAITGLVPITSGSISFAERTIAVAERGASEGMRGLLGRRASWSTDRIVALGVALVPEGRRVFAEMTVQENLDMGAFLVRDEEKVRAKAEEMFALFPILRERRRQKAGSLSGGEQQMLAIARALMSSPRLLLLDEPGLGLAPLIIRDIFEIIVRINREEGVTVFLVEQNARMALAVSQKGYVLETGVVVLDDRAASLLANERVKAAYLGE